MKDKNFKYLSDFRIRVVQLACGALLLTSSCSMANFASTEGIFGAIAGAGAGAGIGQIIGDKLGKKTENTALAGGIGAATGLAVGGYINSTQVETAKEKAEVIREAKEIDVRQNEIDDMRERLYSESSWGRLEKKPWNLRYQIETSEYPYQGVSLK